MLNQYFPGNVVRNKPSHDGKFEVFVVEGHVLDMLEVRSRAHTHVETEFWKPDDVELYEFTSSFGTYRIGDTVRIFGLEGTHKVSHFGRDEDFDEITVYITKGNVPFAAHWARKVEVLQ